MITVNNENNLPHYLCILQVHYNNFVLTVVVDASPPTNLTVVSNEFDEIKVSWSQPSSRATIIGHQIFYEALGNNTNHGSVDAREDKCARFKLPEGFVYNITMVTKSQYLPSPVAGPITATLGKQYTDAFVVCSIQMHL